MKTRVGFWVPSFRTGGSEVWGLSLLRALDRSRIEITGLGVLNPRQNDRYMVDRAKQHTRVSYGPEGLREVAAASDVVVQWAIPNVADYQSDPPTRVIMVSHADASWPWWADRQRVASPHVYNYVAVSEPARGGVPADRRADTVIIPNCVDHTRLHPPAGCRERMRGLWGVDGRQVLTTVCRLQGEKNPFMVWDVLQHLPEHFVGVLAGDGPLAAEARDRVAAGRGRCIWIGQRRDVDRVYMGADWYINGAETEGFGLSMAEAMWLKLPVVAPRGLGYLAEHPGLAREVSPSCPVELAKGVLTDYADRAGTRLRAERASDFVTEHFSVRRFGERWTNYLESVAG